jgi:hypothetical protein
MHGAYNLLGFDAKIKNLFLRNPELPKDLSIH